MEDKRKPFNIDDFISNEETPVETKIGRKVFIHTTKRVNDKYNFYQVIGEIYHNDNSWGLYWWSRKGEYDETGESNWDLVFSLKKTTRRMTNYELSKWLKEKSEEHRECKYSANCIVYSTFSYLEKDADKIVEGYVIRSNENEWKEPLIEE